MKKNLINLTLSALVILAPAMVAHADYSSAVTSLNAAAYWPLNETNPPPFIYTAKNSGTLGAQGNAFYNNVYIRSGAKYTVDSYFTGPVGGVTSDGDSAAFFNGGTNNNDNAGFMVIPDINHALEPQTPFTAEAWVKPGGGDPNDPTGTSFSSTVWTSILEKGGGGYSYTISGDTSGNAYGWSIELAGIYSVGYPVGWYEPGTAFFHTNAMWIVDFYGGTSGGSPSLEFDVPMFEPTPQWFHLTLTYDGVNAWFYTNGVLAATTVPGLPQSTNTMIAPGQSPLTSSDGSYQFASGYQPDTVNPVVIGDLNPNSSLSNLGYPNSPDGTIGFNCQDFNGAVDEVAIYTNALSPAAVLKHYQDATAGNTTLYTNDVISSNPIVYLRMDEPVGDFSESPTNFTTLPVATNYGVVAGFNGRYQSGVMPGIAGPMLPGFGSKTNAVQFNGFDATVDVGAGQLAKSALDPTNHMPFSVAYWFKANPADCYARFQSILGRGDSGWRSSLDGSGFLRWNPGNGPELTSPVAYNDGVWHQVVGVSDGSKDYLYVDGQLSISGSGVGALGGTPLDLLIGGAPDYTSSEPTRDFAGQITQVACFTNALSAAQVLALSDTAVQLAPVITQNPQPVSVNRGASASLSVVASGQPVTYQWFQGSTPLSDVPGNISGSATAVLTISNATPGNAGSYTVAVANGSGSATSTAATFTVYNNVLLTSDIFPLSPVLYSGGHATFSVVAGGAPPITYQWYSNTVAVAGATNASYLLADVLAATSVYCVASNQFNTATSSVAGVTIILPSASYPAAIVAANPVGFWRLNEANNPSGNNGATAYDYWGGNNGIYTNVTLDQTGYNPSDPAEASAEFGGISTSDSMAYNIPTNVDFSAPASQSSSFSIECWANGYVQSTDAGIVSKGTGGGGEQFNLDTGSDTVSGSVTTHNYRFFVRDASGATHGVSSLLAPDNTWHHLAGVCDEVHGYVALYVDGQLIGTNTISPTAGILASAQNMKIGARPPGSDPTANDDQFNGFISDVSVYNYALSAAQVAAHFDAADIPAKVIAQPANAVTGQNGSATFTVGVEGTPPFMNQWFSNSVPIPGATNTTLVLNNLQAGADASTFYLTTTNAYGTDQSQPATLSVVSGIPQIYTDVHSPFFALEGGTGSESVLAYGTLPLSYQWQFNGHNLTDGAGISGSQSNVLTVGNAQASEAGSYQVIVSNGSGSVTSSVASLIIGSSPVLFNITGGGWSANGNAQISTNTLSVTEGAGSETSSFFYTAPQYIGAFQASWTYQDQGGGGADGSAFCIQNDPRGTSALGGGGGSLGVSGITPSAELEFNVYGPNTVGYAFLTGGATGAGGGVYQAPGHVNVASGDPIKVVLNYANGILAMSFTDAVNGTNFSTAVNVDLPGTVGGETAYVGFTGADGGVSSSQIITNFSFVSIAPQAIQLSATNVVISWPSAILGYQLQQSTNLTTGGWVNVTNADFIANGQHQITVPIRSRNAFYRLIL